jgi:exopolysaccharide biosynthesis polyprenyl glycosylphosphotransferase
MRPAATTTAATTKPITAAATPVRRGRHEQLAARFGLRLDPRFALARFALDAAMLAAGLLMAALFEPAVAVDRAEVGWAALFVCVVLATLTGRGAYRLRFRADLLEDLRTVFGAISLATMSILTLRVLVAGPPDSAVEVIRPWALATVSIAVGRCALRWSQRYATQSRAGLRPTLIVGAGRVGRLAAQRLLDQPELGFRPVGFLDEEPMRAGAGNAVLPVLGASWDLDRVVEEHGVEQVLLGFSTAPDEALLPIFSRCEELGIGVAFVPRLYEKVTKRLTVDHLGGLPVLTARAPKPRGLSYAVKYALDRAAAAVLLALAAPVMLVGGLGVLASVGRPVFFRQRRVGLDGREFQMLKFRSMREPGRGAEAVELDLQPGTAPGGVEGADRRTPFGAFLRKTSLDELPQLLNVLKGDMSIIGPRPERPEFSRRFEESIYRYADRQRVKSGITGWAQVNGLRGKTSLADRVEWDNYYIENRSLWLDLKILLLTVVAVLRASKQVE